MGERERERERRESKARRKEEALAEFGRCGGVSASGGLTKRINKRVAMYAGRQIGTNKIK